MPNANNGEAIDLATADGDAYGINAICCPNGSGTSYVLRALEA
jgi:hypothetical protein